MQRLTERRVVSREVNGDWLFEAFDNGDTRTTSREYREALEQLTREHTIPVSTAFYDYVMGLADPAATVIIENIPDEPVENQHFM